MAIPLPKDLLDMAQACIQGGQFIVRLLIFTENKICSLTGTDIELVQGIADTLYQYIPNVFSDCNPFSLSYILE